MDILEYFPEKDNKGQNTFYPYQKESIQKIYDAFLGGNDIVIGEIPWGVGKTHIAKTFANFFNKTYILTASKGLQAQVITKFPDIKEVKGRGNFPCKLNSRVMCDRAMCNEKEFVNNSDTPVSKACPHKPVRGEGRKLITGDREQLCEYWKQKIDAIEAKTSSHNYDYFLAEINHVGDFSVPRVYNDTDLQKMSLGIFDEAHNIGTKILKNYSITITRSFLYRAGIPFPDNGNDRDAWISWLKELRDVSIPQNLKSIYDQLKQTYMEQRTKDELYSKIEKSEEVLDKINAILKVYDLNKNIWMTVAERDKGNQMKDLKVIPIMVSPFVQEELLQHFDRMLFLSSTILNPYLFVGDLGLKRMGHKVNFTSVPCPFPLSHRPIYAMNIGDMGYECLPDNIPKIVEAVKTLLDLYPNQKGIIHSNSFKLNNDVWNSLPVKYANRIVSHSGETYNGSGKTYQDAIQEHFESDLPTVLMSPSIIEGVDFKGKFSEFQIIFKLFYDSEVDSPQLKARKLIDPLYYEWLACVKTIQATGRSIRSMDDIAPTFYLDSRLTWFVRKNSDLLSKWWRDAIIYAPNPYSYIGERLNATRSY